MEKTLSPDDAATILEELLDAQNHAKYIGLKLKVPQHIVDATYSHPRDCLYSVIMEYLKQVDPRPTRKAIADAFRSRLVGLPRLAEAIGKYCPLPQTLSEQGTCT